jgi:L-lactate utilization protein LutB
MTLVARIAEEGARLAAACTACGACVSACPMIPHAPAAEAADSARVAGGMRAVLLGEGASAVPESIAWIAACTRSAQCNSACPERLDVALMLRFASMRVRGALGETARHTTRPDPGWSSRVKAFARVSLTEEEQARWL